MFGISEPKALTTGGSLSYQSGYVANLLQLNAVLYTTKPLYANAEAGSTWNLSPDGDQITVLGQANGRLNSPDRSSPSAGSSCARRLSTRTTPG